MGVPSFLLHHIIYSPYFKAGVILFSPLALKATFERFDLDQKLVGKTDFFSISTVLSSILLFSSLLWSFKFSLGAYFVSIFRLFFFFLKSANVLNKLTLQARVHALLSWSRRVLG